MILIYVLVSLVAGGLVLALSTWSLLRLEVRLQKIDMGIAIERIRTELTLGGTGRPGRFFHGVAGSDAFPPELRGYTPGFYKLARQGDVWHGLVRDEDGQRFILLRDYTQYEHMQQSAMMAGVISLLAVVALTFVLGLITTGRLVRPVQRLAARMTSRAEQPPNTRLTPDFPPNEIGTLAQAFDTTYNHLEEALQRERLFTADVGHELRTPLMAALSACEVLRDEPGLDAQVAAQLLRIEMSMQDMHQRLQTYLILARGEGDCLGFPHAGLAQIVAEQGQLWASSAQRQGLQLLTLIEPGADGGPSYPVPLLRAVLANLLRNAVQYAGSGRRIELRCGADWLQVQDDGPGIAVARQAEIFHPFVRGGQPDNRNLGIGLSLVQRICNHQAWRVQVTSAPGEGTCFRVDLVPL
jgi:signal transduction histidine kinase